MTILLADHATARLDGARVFTALEIQSQNESFDAANWSMQSASFLGELLLQDIDFVGSLDFSGGHFHAPIRFGKTQMPQQTRGNRLKFKRGGVDSRR